MRMRVQHRIHTVDTGTKRLRAKVGTGIDQHDVAVVAQDN